MDIIDQIVSEHFEKMGAIFLQKLDPETKDYLYNNFQIGVSSKYYKIKFENIDDKFYNDKVLMFVDKTGNPLSIYPMKTNIYDIKNGIRPLSENIDTYIKEVQKFGGSVYYLQKAKKEKVVQEEVKEPFDATLDKDRFKNFVNTRGPFIKGRLNIKIKELVAKIEDMKKEIEEGNIFGYSDINMMVDDSLNDLADLSNIFHKFYNSDAKEISEADYKEIDSFIQKSV